MFTIYRIAYVTDRRTDRDLDKNKCYDCQANYIRDLTKLRRQGQRQSKKTIGLVSKTTPLHVHHPFLYISLPSLHDYDVKWPNLKFFFEDWNGKAINSTISIWTQTRLPLFSSNINSLFLSNWATWNNREMVSWKSPLSDRKVPIVAWAKPRPWERTWPEPKLITLVRMTAQ